jgi:DHA2 family multidrug resistance protein
MVWSIYHKRESVIHKLPIDSVGLGLLVLWVGALQIMLDKGKELDWFHSPEVVALGVVALVGFAFFLAWELTEEHPVVDLRLFARRNFWSGTLAIAVGYGLFFGNVVLLPLWLQQFMGYPSTDAGMLLAPVGLFAIILSPVVGKNIGRVDPRYLASFAFVVFALVLLMRSHFNTQADFGTIMLPTVIQGVAMAFFFIPLSVIVLSGITPDKIPAASGLSSFARIVAGSFGTSIATTVWQDRAAMHHAQLAESIQAGNQVASQSLAGLASAGMSPDQALATINRLVDQQAYMLAVNDVFYASAMIFLLLIPVVWLSRPKRAGGASADAGAGAH